jgi:hypothetical protein
MIARRTFLKTLSGGTVAAITGLLSPRAIAGVAKAAENEFFIFIHAAGGWDVTLWADPRNELRGIVHPASTENTDTAPLRRWVDAPLVEGARTFELIHPPNSNLVFGPGIGDLAELCDRVTIVNGLEMNTVAHPDGAIFSATGRHLQGGHVIAPSIDTMIANEFGADQLLPSVSVRFPSAFVGANLDRRVVPLAIDDVAAIGHTLSRQQAYDSDSERDLVTAMLSEEAHDLAKRTVYPATAQGIALQYEALRRMLGSNMQQVFSTSGLRGAHPEFNYKARFTTNAATNSAFAIESMKRNLVCCVSFAVGGFDTHGNIYRTQAQLQQETFDLIATLVRSLDAAPHPTLAGAKLSDHSHLLVVSEFCRTPQINLQQGRDHYPNNSALVISPRFKANYAFGKTDVDEVLPLPTKTFVNGARAIAPPDLLATFLAAFGVDPRKYMRDGEVVRELLRS